MQTRGRTIRVLVVDDSSVVRQVLSRALSNVPDIEVIGTATDPYIARDKIVKLQPDVITLDIEMPRMDGLTFLEKLMEHHPLPVIVVSSLTHQGGAKALEAMAAGAVDVVCKTSGSYSIADLTEDLADRIRAAAVAQIRRPERVSKQTVERAQIAEDAASLIAMGTSTGGTRALQTVLSRMPANMPGVVMVQHMPPEFTERFAARLDDYSVMTVRQAEDGDVVKPGLALLAPGDLHMQVAKRGSQWEVRLRGGPKVSGHRPSVDVLFESVAKAAGPRAIGVIMTGMGADGADGLLKMRRAGAQTIGEAASSCVVYGMPRAAAECGAVERVTPLPAIAGELRRLLGHRRHERMEHLA